ncbi:hypothetical protein HDU86_006494 [Geranomyces michiganensis]|nr:hypothetical protein HDU86_006494 [Geranomyces michiganensis]
MGFPRLSLSIDVAGPGPFEERFHALYGEYASLAALVKLRFQVMERLAGTPATYIVDRNGELWNFILSATAGLSELRSELSSLHRSVCLTPHSRTQTRGAYLAVGFFGDLTQPDGQGCQDVLNAAIDEAESARKSLRLKLPGMAATTKIPTHPYDNEIVIPECGLHAATGDKSKNYSLGYWHKESSAEA